MGVNFIIKRNLIISKNCKFSSKIKYEIENVENLRQIWVENFESKFLSELKFNRNIDKLII